MAAFSDQRGRGIHTNVGGFGSVGGGGFQTSIAPRSNPTLINAFSNRIGAPRSGMGEPQVRGVTRPGGQPAQPTPALKPKLPVSSPTAPTTPAAPKFGASLGSQQQPAVTRPAITGAPTAAPKSPATGIAPPSGGAGIPPNLLAAMPTPGGGTQQMGGMAPTPATPVPQQAPATATPAAGQQTTPSATPQIQRPSMAMNPAQAATPAQTPGGAGVFRRGAGGLLGASGGRLEGGLGVPGTLGAQQAVPTELLAFLAQQGRRGTRG